eukprot:1906802-Pleurochrysis_carterae.AAC.1
MSKLRMQTKHERGTDARSPHGRNIHRQHPRRWQALLPSAAHASFCGLLFLSLAHCQKNEVIAVMRAAEGSGATISGTVTFSQ